MLPIWRRPSKVGTMSNRRTCRASLPMKMSNANQFPNVESSTARVELSGNCQIKQERVNPDGMMGTTALVVLLRHPDRGADK